jgi:hypothetical protein
VRDTKFPKTEGNHLSSSLAVGSSHTEAPSTHNTKFQAEPKIADSPVPSIPKHSIPENTTPQPPPILPTPQSLNPTPGYTGSWPHVPLQPPPPLQPDLLTKRPDEVGLVLPELPPAHLHSREAQNDIPPELPYPSPAYAIPSQPPTEEHWRAPTIDIEPQDSIPKQDSEVPTVHPLRGDSSPELKGEEQGRQSIQKSKSRGKPQPPALALAQSPGLSHSTSSARSSSKRSTRQKADGDDEISKSHSKLSRSTSATPKTKKGN